jgi:hypothetical protein
MKNKNAKSTNYLHLERKQENFPMHTTTALAKSTWSNYFGALESIKSFQFPRKPSTVN